MTLCMDDLVHSVDPVTRSSVSVILAEKLPDPETCDRVSDFLACAGLHPGDANALASWAVYDRKRCW